MAGVSWQRPWIRFVGGANGALGIYGDGSDGDVTITSKGGEISLSRDMYYQNLTMGSGGVLNTNGFRVFVRDTLTMSSTGHIHRDGNAGESNGDNPATQAAGTTQACAPGGFGGWSALASDGNGQSAGGISPGGMGGGGEQGGDGNAAWLPGDGGVSTNQAVAGLQTIPSYYIGITRGTAVINITVKIGGGGGGGGAASDADDSVAPSGGNGGGVVIVCARTLDITSGALISARGGAGGDSSGNDTGGGGGGGGGCVLLITDSDYADFSSTLTISAAEGAGGAPTGSGTAGFDGTEGFVFVLSGDV